MIRWFAHPLDWIQPLFRLSAVCALMGCGVQLSGGPTLHSNGAQRIWGVGAVAIRGTLGRTANGTGALVGTRMGISVDPSANVLTLRNGEINVGVQLPPQRLGQSALGIGIEASVDLGLGGPENGWSAPLGIYSGATATCLFRVAGPVEPRAQVIGARVAIDLLTSVRAGVWTAVEGVNVAPVGSGALELGLRLTILSDLLSYEPEARRP